MLAVVGLAATACSDDPADVAPPTTTPQSTVAPTTTEGPPPEFDIVGTALYLASDASGYLTGELILLDGGGS